MEFPVGLPWGDLSTSAVLLMVVVFVFMGVLTTPRERRRMENQLKAVEADRDYWRAAALTKTETNRDLMETARVMVQFFRALEDAGALHSTRPEDDPQP